MFQARTLCSRLLPALLLGVGALPRLEGAPVFSLFEAKPAQSEAVEKKVEFDRPFLRLTTQSRLSYPIAAEKIAEQGTVIFAVRPGAEFGSRKDAPEILFQLGGNHYEPNSITLFRETDGRLLLIFFGEKKRVFQQWDKSVLRKGKLNTLAVSYDREKVRLFLNGRLVTTLATPGPIRFKPAALHLGMPARDRPDWHFAGDVTAFEIDDTRLPDEAIVERMKELADDTIAPLNETAPYIRNDRGIVRIGGAKFELQVEHDGTPKALYDKLAGRFVIRDWSMGNYNWWSIDTFGKNGNVSVANTHCPGTFSTDGKSAVWRYRIPENGSVFTVTVTPAPDGTLRFNHAFDNRFAQPVRQIYFPQLGGFEKGKAESWVLMPYWQGVRSDLRQKFKFMCWGGPGHLSMLLIGLKLDDSTLLFYPQDTIGNVKFAIADDRNSGPDGAVLLNWQNRDWVQPHENYRAGYDFVLDNVGDTGMRGLADRYREWAEKQPWFITRSEKLKRYPGGSAIENGIIKMVGYEAIVKNSSVYEPDTAAKDKECPLTFDYNRFLEVAEQIEKVYRVKPAYRFDGWWGRFDSAYPAYFPVNPRLGDFREFMAKNHAANRTVILHTNPMQADFDSPGFDIRKQAMSPGGTYQNQVWSRNMLYVVTPRAILADEVNAIKAMRDHGANGIFEDVIGSTTMLDVNPAGNYPYWHRDAGTVALLELCKALREASGPLFRGTEGGEERRIPYYDAFMMEAGNSEENVPFFSMVYGDCVANAIGIGGGGDGSKALDRARRMLFGVVLGLDSRGDWAQKRYVPSAQLILETQKVLSSILGQRIRDYRNTGRTYLSEWDTGATVANLGAEAVDRCEFDTTIGKISVEGVAPSGSVFVEKSGRFAAWLCRRATLNGKVLFDLGRDAATAVVDNGSAVVIGNLGNDALELTPVLPGLQTDGRFERRPADRFEPFKPGNPVKINAGEALYFYRKK